MYLRKIKPCVYEVWKVDEAGCPVLLVGMFGKFSKLCKYDDYYEHFAMCNLVGNWHWLFDSDYYEPRIFNDYFIGRRYVRGLG